MLDSTRCFHVCTAMHGLSLKCSTRGFPSYRGLIRFSAGLGGAIFLKLKGNIMSDPLPDIFSTCGECLQNIYDMWGEFSASKKKMSVAFILEPCVAQVSILLIRFAKNMFTHNLALPFWEHCALLFWYGHALPSCTTMHWLSLKCSTRGFPSYRGLIWFSCGLGQALPVISFQFVVNISWILWGDSGLWNFMSVEGLLNFAHIFYFHVTQVCMLMTTFAKNIIPFCASSPDL